VRWTGTVPNTVELGPSHLWSVFLKLQSWPEMEPSTSQPRCSKTESQPLAESPTVCLQWAHSSFVPPWECQGWAAHLSVLTPFSRLPSRSPKGCGAFRPSMGQSARGRLCDSKVPGHLPPWQQFYPVVAQWKPHLKPGLQLLH
jgi:hypothetical protein